MKQQLFISKLCGLLSIIFLTSSAQADIIKITAGQFNAGSHLISFDELASGTINPMFDYSLYGGNVGDTQVSFAGWFSGQSLSLTPEIDCPGAAATACVVGTPNSNLSLDVNATQTRLFEDVSNPTSPVITGSPSFNGAIAILFSVEQYAVGFDAGFFDGIGTTAITAFSRDGSLVGSVANSARGVEFLGLASAGNSQPIAGVFLDLIANEPGGFAIDNLRFAQSSDDIDGPEPTSVAEPGSLLVFSLSIACLALMRISQRPKN